ncbi:MAG TPA: putative N-acetylmannosamine-6-phosphate 2-epimerase, partial [Terriglobia bacterium]|nr:putative N-acetylmannosamine-6-phosphate 2-epimerase [Terriglobia bacterium]
MTANEVTRAIQGRLVVSCQATEGEVFHDPQLMARFAAAAVAGGAAAIRANGTADIHAIRGVVRVPIIGIQKVRHRDGLPLITPSFESATALLEAGADMVALDCTKRGQESGALDRIREIRKRLNVPVLADVAQTEEAIAAAEAGADFVLSTLRGYTEETNRAQHFDPGFIQDLVRASSVPVIAEGRISSPEQARQAVAAGALAVVVGTAITRPSDITRSFAAAINSEYLRRNKPSHAVGIDLGGTQTKYGVVRSDGALLFKSRVETPARSGDRAVLENLKRVTEIATTYAKDNGYEPVAIGVATGGWVDAKTGRVVYATDNLPGWTGARIGEELASLTELPVAVENDANALAVGERSFGAAKLVDDFVCLTLGTGLGGGCYVGGDLNRGAHFFANQVGHFPFLPDGMPCSCGLQGCLEPYVNASALTRYAGKPQASAADVIAAANAGEERACEAIRTLGRYLARGCATLVAVLDPQAVILGGG